MKMNRKVVRSVICVLLALIFIVSLMTALIPINASAASQSEINQLTQQRKELQAKQKEQQKTINNLRSKKASVVDQKAALDQENDLAQQEIEVVKQQITAYDQQIEDKGVELEEAKQEEEAQTVRFRGCVRHLEEYGQMSYIAILLEATSLSDLLARMDMVGEVIAYNKQVQADMTAAREKVETVKAELEDARTELQDKQSELETKQVELQQKVSEANALLASLESDINAYKSVYDQYEQQQQNVQSQIDKQVEDLRRQEELNRVISEVDYVTVASSSAARALAAMLEPEQRKKLTAKLISIGPSTAKAMEKLGLPVYADAVEYTAEGIASVIRADVEEML